MLQPGLSSAYSNHFRRSASAGTSAERNCPEVSSRCLRSRARSSEIRRYSCLMSRVRDLLRLIVQKISAILRNLKFEGLTIVLVEQNFALAMDLADHVVVLGKGRVRWSGTPLELERAVNIRQAWLGV